MKMTSRIYGIAVKDTVDYYDYGDIRIQFNKDTKHWSILSNYDNVWYNGTNYTEGQLILMFSDYTVAEYNIMAQYTETIPYKNYIYKITTNAEINPSTFQNGKVEYVFEADPENEPYTFTCKKLINNVFQKKYTITDVDIKNYKNKTNGQLPDLFYNLKMDWHGMNPESPYLPYSFTIISNSNYIKDGTAPKQVGDIVLQIPAGVGQYPYYHKILDETNKHEAKKNANSLPVVNIARYINGAIDNPTDSRGGKSKSSFTRETIIQKVYHDHTKVYYNGHYHRAMYCVVDSTGSDIGCWKKNFKGLAFAYADPFWFCMTTSSGFEYGGRVLESKKLVKCWKGTDPINMTLSKTTSRKKPAPNNAPYDDIIYDVVSNDVNVTVTRIRRKTHIDASGHKTTEDIEEGLPIVFDTSSSPVLCWNIEFRASNNVWTIYSKCGYIRYNGRQYPKNRSILDFNAGEEMHIEIKDETEKYEVDEVVTYTISNVTATAFIYKLWTVGTSYTLKVEKSVPGEDPEPWVTVNFYDAIYDPVIIDDIQISFDNSKRVWKLVSRSDDLYYYDKKLAYGDLIAEWGLNTVFSLKDNNALKVILPNPDMDIRIKAQSNKVDFNGVDISDFIPRDLNEASYLDLLVVHSVTKGVWTVTSKNDNTYVGGTRYTYNKEIFSCSDKQGMPEIDIMCQHKRDEYGQPISPYENWHYFISISYDSYEQMGTMVINCKKQATAPQTGWVTIFSQTYYSREKEDPEYQNRTTMILTKENSKSMYGYIWKRDMPGPTPPGSDRYDFYIITKSGSGYWYTEKLVGIKATGVKRSSVIYTTRGSGSYLRLLGKVGFRLFIQDSGLNHVIYSDDYGDTWTRAEGLPSEQIVRIVNAMQLVTDYSLGKTFVTAPFKVFSIAGDTVYKTKETIEHEWWSYDIYYADPPSNKNIIISCSEGINGYANIKKFDISNETVDGPYEDIEAYNTTLKAEWNWSKIEPEVSETQRTDGFICSRTISIGDKILMLAHMTCIYRKGSPIGAFPPIERVVWDWGVCAYEYGSSGLSILYKQAISDSDYAKLENWVTHMDVKFGEYYYGYNWLTRDSYCYIFRYSSGSINIVKSIPKGSLLFSIKVYRNSSFSDYDDYDVYCGINSTSIDWINKKIYIRPDSFSNKNSLYNNKEYIMGTQSGSDGSSSIHIFLDNPLFNSSPNNFAVIDSVF